ncbi:MAG TPA: sensor histidine kinase [Candidatus Wunengus sp. YC60]|uniref:sensor histidine kinase n=1 Tax=Candidatus Wunengus sp. YC60 TaxID=3367697 RepID=UPI00402735F3
MPKFQKILHPEKFNLILYYAVTSFAVIAILSLVVGWIFPRMEGQALIKRSEEYTQYFISHLNYEMYKDFFLPTLRRDKQIDLKNNRKQFEKFDKIVQREIYGLKINKLYLYDTEGHIIYSTVPEHVGLTIDRGTNKRLDSAIRGVPASALHLAETTDSKGLSAAETLLESYYPFYEVGKGEAKKEQIGVLEIHQDMSGFNEQITGSRQKAIIMTSSSMGILFLVLFLVVLKAARIINMRTKQLVDARNTLEQKVEDRTLEIREAYKKLQHTQRKLIHSEKLASIGILVTGLAHEINNPLASVAGCAEGLTDRLKNILDRKEGYNSKEEWEIFPEYLKVICDETYRCKTIISNLLNFSRQSEPEFVRIDINRVVNDTLSVVQRQSQIKMQDIQLDLSKDPCVVIGDPQQLKQVFMNLIINALHATEGSGVISISTCRKQAVVQIVVKDSGVGIKPEHLGKIFDPFFTTKPTGKGTGLGLAICYGIIDVHNGRIEAHSEGAGKGATFTVTLPSAT